MASSSGPALFLVTTISHAPSASPDCAVNVGLIDALDRPALASATGWDTTTLSGLGIGCELHLCRRECTFISRTQLPKPPTQMGID